MMTVAQYQVRALLNGRYRVVKLHQCRTPQSKSMYTLRYNCLRYLQSKQKFLGWTDVYLFTLATA